MHLPSIPAVAPPSLWFHWQITRVVNTAIYSLIPVVVFKALLTSGALGNLFVRFFVAAAFYHLIMNGFSKGFHGRWSWDLSWNKLSFKAMIFAMVLFATVTLVFSP